LERGINMSKRTEEAIFWLGIGVIIFVEALSLFGKAVGYWELNFPFWATIFVWIGFAIVYTAVRKLISSEVHQSNTRFWGDNYSRRWFRRWRFWNSKFWEFPDEEVKKNEKVDQCC
jgi:hypothetical protein